MSYTNMKDAQLGLMSVMGDMPEDIRTGVIEELSNPVMIEALVYTGEYLYSRRGDLPTGPVREAAANFIEFRSNNGFFGAHVDMRGPKMVAATRAGTVSDNDPAVDPRFGPKNEMLTTVPMPVPTPVVTSTVEEDNA